MIVGLIQRNISIQADTDQDAIACTLMQDNKQILHASMLLSECECQYTQIKKEFLVVTYVFNKCNKFFMDTMTSLASLIIHY